MKKKDYENGIWRTIGGRRVFIRKGQDLSSAMKESGKFKTKMNEKAVKGAREEDLKDQYIESLNNVSKMEYNGEITRDEYDEAIKNINKEYKNRKMGDKFYTKKDETNRYKEKTLNDVYSYTDKQIDENKNPLFSREDKFYTRKDGTREYDPYKGTRFEKKYDSVEDRYNRDKDFRDMLKGEHEKTLKATRGEINSYFDLENRDEEIGSKDDLYKMINENYYNVSKEDFEKIYSEEASARYNKADEQMKKTFGEDFHFAGEELYSDDPNRYGDIVRNHNERNALKDRYQGTYKYLQSTTNMSGAEILELLKKIDEDRK